VRILLREDPADEWRDYMRQTRRAQAILELIGDVIETKVRSGVAKALGSDN